ncbi:MAG: DUF4012 domain-containing protein [Actinomycetales bacterium]|nr:DUF4012 domain-containing protein [Actinomycetales bacterium]
MSDLTDTASTPQGKGKPLLITFLLIILASIIYLAYSAVQVQYHLARVKSQLQQAAVLGVQLNGQTAAELLRDVKLEIADANKWASGPIWWTASHIPYLGRTPNAIHAVTENLDRTLRATDNLEQALEKENSNNSFRNYKFVLGLSDSLVELQRPIASGATELTALRLAGVPEIVAGPVRQLADGYSNLVPITTDAVLFSKVAPALLGLDKPRKWMLVFQNGAEARSVGGFPGGWGILTASTGKLSLSPLYKETTLMKQPLTNYSDYVSREQAALYGSDLSRMSDLNLSPDFPTNARLMAALEVRNFGTQIDGVMSMNEKSLANFMQVSGPVKVGKRTITSENAADYVTKGVYQDYQNPKAKDAAIFLLIEKTFTKFQSGTVSPIRMLQAFIPAIHSQNLHAWSADNAVQQKILQTPLSGSMANVNKPSAAVVLINGAGNKLDAYVKAQVVYNQGICESDFPYRDATMRVTLKNEAPTSGLPKYVTTRYDLGDLSPKNPGATKMIVYVHVPFGSVFESAKIGNADTPLLVEGVDLGRTVFRFDVDLPAQSSQNLIIKFAEPAVGEVVQPSLWTQPMPNPVKTKVIAGLGCN